MIIGAFVFRWVALLLTHFTFRVMQNRWIVLLLILSIPSVTLGQTVERVTDGDTFRILLNGKSEAVRLTGIDTPESKPNKKARKDADRTGQDLALIVRLGKRSTDYLKRTLPKGTKVRLEFDVRERDGYGRLLAYVYLPSGLMLNELILLEGYATPMTIPPNVKYADRFRAAHAKARD